MTTLQEITVEFSKDTYKLEIKEGSFGKKYYSIWINGRFDRTYQRLSKDLKEFFNYKTK